MAKENIKNNKKELTRAERHFGVLLESMDSKLDLVVEGQDLLNKKVDRHHQEFQEFKEEANYKFNLHTDMIAKLATDTEIIKSDLEIIKSGLRKKVDWEDFEALEKRVILLERKAAQKS